MARKEKTAWLPHPLTLLSAVFYVLAFPPWGYSILAPFALVPWLIALAKRQGLRPLLREGLWMGFLVGILGFTWVATALHQYGPLPWPLSILGLLLFSLAGQPQFIAFAGFTHLLFNRERDLPFQLKAAPALALLYTGLDWILPKLFADTLGHALYNQPIARQAADLGGAPLLTFVLVLFSLVLAAWITRIRNRREPSLWPVIHATLPLTLLSLLFLSGDLVYGTYRLPEIDAHFASAPTVEIAAIQANIGDFDKIAAEQGVRGAGDKVVNKYIEESRTALSPNASAKHPDLLVWPETAYPSTFRKPLSSDDLFHEQKIERFVKEADTPLLFGGYDRTMSKPEVDYNALFALHPDGSLETYRKNILLLFGEYIPLSDRFTWLKQAFPTVGNFGHGSGPTVLSVKLGPENGKPRALKLSPVICYEVLFPNYVIEAARKGSELILNVTNDSWFGPWAEPDQHLALAAFRSIETRLPELRSTNTGISALVTPTGEIAKATPIGETAVLRAQIPKAPSPFTLMKAFGDWFGPFAVGASLAWLFLLLFPAWRKERSLRPN